MQYHLTTKWALNSKHGKYKAYTIITIYALNDIDNILIVYYKP